MAKKEIGVIFRNYPYGDDALGGDKSMHSDRLYIARNIEDIFSDIMIHSRIYERLGQAYAYIYEDELKGKPACETYIEYVSNELNILKYYYEHIKTGKYKLSELKGIYFWGRFSGQDLVFYKVVDVIQDEQKLKEKEAEFKADGMLYRHMYFFD